MKEAYVTFDTAELLKEKNFDWECRSYYEYFSSDVTLFQGMLPELSEAESNFNNKGSDICSRPTQQMACDWVEETYGFFIEVWRYNDSSDGSYRYCYRIINGASKYVTNIVSDYLSKHEAIEAALQYVLTNLI